MKAKLYDFNMVKATWKCPRGIEICHHIAAAMFASHYEVSKTDVACSWVPTPSNDNVKSWKELYNINTPERLTERDLLDHEIEQFKINIRNELCCGFGWILDDEPDNADADVAADINCLLLSEEYENSDNRKVWLQKRLQVNDEKVKMISAATIGHHTNINWINVRRFRITASNFGVFIASMKRKRYPPSLFNRLIGQKDSSGIKAVQWDRTHDIDGIKMLETYLEKKVIETGIWLSNSGMLGASPDGLVEDSVVEVKYRYKSRESSLTEDLSRDLTYIYPFDMHWTEATFRNK